MKVESVSHKALRRFFETGETKGLNAQITPRLSRMFQFLGAVQSEEELRSPPNYGAHPLKGDRAGEWALTVTKNWRMTFKLTEDFEIIDLDLEDYHGT